MENNYLFVLKRDKPFFVNIIGGMILFFAILRILNSPLSGVLMAIAGIGFFALQSGIEINFEENLYRNVTIIGPQMFGNWNKIPELDYVSLFRTNLVHSATAMSGNSVSQKSSVLQVSLISTNRNKIKVFESSDLSEALIKAKEFAEKLNLDIWDATKRDADWYAEKS